MHTLLRCATLGLATAFINAAALCDAVGAPVDLLAEVVAGYADPMAPLINSFVDMIVSRTYDSHDLRLEGAAHSTRAIADFGRTVGVDVDLFDNANRTLATASETNHGINIAAIFETLRKTE